MSEETKKYLPFILIGGVVVLLLLLRSKSSSSAPTIVNTGVPSTDIPPNATNLQYAGLQAQNFKNILDYSLSTKTLAASQQLNQLQSAFADKQLAAQQSMQGANLSTNERVQLANIEAQRTVGLAAAQNENLAQLSLANARLASIAAQNGQAQAQARQNALGSILSALQQLMRSNSKSPTSSSPNGGQSQGQTAAQRHALRYNPSLPPIDNADPFAGFSPYFPAFDGYSYDPYSSFAFGELGAPPDMFAANPSGAGLTPFTSSTLTDLGQEFDPMSNFDPSSIIGQPPVMGEDYGYGLEDFYAEYYP
jgi:hypothetical protein